MTNDAVLQQILKQILITSPKVEKLEAMMSNVESSIKEFGTLQKAEISRLDSRVSLLEVKTGTLEKFKKDADEAKKLRHERWWYVFDNLGVKSGIQSLVQAAIVTFAIFVLGVFYSDRIKPVIHPAVTVENNINPRRAS